MRNVRTLINQWGGPTSLAKKLRLSGSSYLAQLTSGHRPITEKTARKIEAQLGLATGWLDADHDATTRSVRLDDTLLTRTITLVAAVIEETHVTVPPDKLAEIVSWVYEDASETGNPSEALVRRIVAIVK